MSKQRAYVWIFIVLLLLALSICGIVAYANNIATIPAQPTPTAKPVTPTIEPTFIVIHPTPQVTPTATPWTVPPIKMHPKPVPVIDGKG